jgi:hypothetical protein
MSQQKIREKGVFSCVTILPRVCQCVASRKDCQLRSSPIARGKKTGGAFVSRSGTKAPRWGKTVRLAKFAFFVINAPRKSNVTTSVPALPEHFLRNETR